MDPELIDRIFALSPDVRYVAVYRGGEPLLRERAGIADPSAAESDRYEELIVNPTLLKLVTQRGNIDCGGVEYVIIRYGRFFQIVRPLADGHLSVAVEPQGDPVAVAAAIDELLGARASRPPSNSASLPQANSASHKGWYSRDYLPHFDRPGLVQSITFRLADSIPAEVLEGWKVELSVSTQLPQDDPRIVELRQRISAYEDAGHGACHLRNPTVAAVVEDALLHFDGDRYRLLAWCIMPNHVHAMAEIVESHRLPDVVHSWKSFTAKEANRLLRRDGEFWMADYFDRFIRDERHLRAAVEYIHYNPVKAGLVDRAEDWRFSSAWERGRPAR